MSAFNTIEASVACPNCRVACDFEVQFKFGDTWQHRYRVGDMLRWGGNDIGKPGYKEVIVDGVGGPCPSCGIEFIDFDVTIVNDHVVGARPAATPRPPGGDDGYLVVRK